MRKFPLFLILVILLMSIFFISRYRTSETNQQPFTSDSSSIEIIHSNKQQSTVIIDDKTNLHEREKQRNEWMNNMHRAEPDSTIDSIKRIQSTLPPPTEIAQYKSDKKDLKRLRNEWMNNMHRAEPGIDWKAINSRTRKERSKTIMAKRMLLKNTGQLESSLSKPEKIEHLNITGAWKERGSNNLSGRIMTADIDFSTNQIYCASQGGQVWRGNLDGTEWASITDYIHIPNISFINIAEINQNSRRLLIGDNIVFYYSDDSGATLNEARGLGYSDDGWGFAKRYIIKTIPNIEIYALALVWDYTNWNSVVRIFKSSDNGATFSIYYTFDSTDAELNNYDIWTSRYSDSPIFVIHNGDLFELSNGSLSSIATIDASSVGKAILTGGFDGTNHFLYARISNQIFKSLDSGNTWISTGLQPTDTFLVNSLNSSNIDPNILAIGFVDAYFSIDGASTWNLVNNWWEYYGNEQSMLHADIPEIRWFIDNAGNEIALISTDGGIYYSSNNLNTVSNLSQNGLNVSQYYSTYTQPNYPYNIYAGSQDQGFQRAVAPPPGILTYEQVISGDYGHLVSQDGGESIWANYPGFTFYKASPETGFDYIEFDFPGDGFLWLAPLTHHINSPNVAYLGGGGSSGGNHVFKLTASGSLISSEEINYDFDSKVSAMAMSPKSSSTFYVLTEDGYFYWSKDGLQTWDKTQSFQGTGAHYFYGSCILPSQQNEGTVWISGSGYSNPGVYVSNNYGETFSALDSGLPNTLVYKLATNEDESFLYAATHVGPYILDLSNGNTSWEYLGELSTPDQVYWSVEYIPALETVRFGTHGRGIWDFTITSLNTEKEELSELFGLKQNYPNPFNGITEIKYNIAQQTNVQIKIFNLNGHEVKLIKNNVHQPGEYSVTWDGTDNSGQLVSGGVYFYKLQADNFIQTKKMILLK